MLVLADLIIEGAKLLTPLITEGIRTYLRAANLSSEEKARLLAKLDEDEKAFKTKKKLVIDDQGNIKVVDR